MMRVTEQSLNKLVYRSKLVCSFGQNTKIYKELFQKVLKSTPIAYDFETFFTCKEWFKKTLTVGPKLEHRLET